MKDFFKNIFNTTPVDIPPFWEDYLEFFKNKHSLKDSFRSTRFVVFDTETTGLEIKKDKICQIGAIAIKGNSILMHDFFDTLVKQESGGVSASKQIHGLLDKGIQTGLDEKQAAIHFINYIKDAVLVAHHAAFDVAMINQVLKKHWPGLRLKNEVLDTALLERRLKPTSAYAIENPSNFTLDALAKQYEIGLSDRHTAIGDAYITAQIFLKIAARLEKKGVNTLKKLIG